VFGFVNWFLSNVQRRGMCSKPSDDSFEAVKLSHWAALVASFGPILPQRRLVEPLTFLLYLERPAIGSGLEHVIDIVQAVYLTRTVPVAGRARDAEPCGHDGPSQWTATATISSPSQAVCRATAGKMAVLANPVGTAARVAGRPPHKAAPQAQVRGLTDVSVCVAVAR